jgi:ABC-2 type transport system ATP-binding protein
VAGCGLGATYATIDPASEEPIGEVDRAARTGLIGAEIASYPGRQPDAEAASSSMAETVGTEPAQSALAVEGLSHSFASRKALDGVSFAIAPGSFTVLLGQNGAGKTTLFNLITRLYSNRSGSIRIFGTDVRAKPSRALAALGVVFQQRTIDLDLSVMQNLLYAGGLQGLPRAVAKRRAVAELERFELGERAADKVRELSGGQLRRVEIARALLHRPKLLLLDEPTVGLDIGSRQTILEHVRRLCAEERIGVLWATHLIDEVAAQDQVIVLHQGRILALGDGAAVCAKAKASDLRGAFTKLTAQAA